MYKASVLMLFVGGLSESSVSLQVTPAESPAPSPLPQRNEAAAQPQAPVTPPPLTTLVVESPCIDVPALQARPVTFRQAVPWAVELQVRIGANLCSVLVCARRVVTQQARCSSWLP